MSTGLTNRFREAQAEHVEQSLEAAGIPTLATRCAEGLDAEVSRLRLRQADLLLLGNEEAVGLVQTAIEKLETARRAVLK